VGKYLFTLEAPLSVRRMDERVRQILEGRHFSLKKEECRGSVSLAGDKHRYASLGTFPLHLSLILLLAGILVAMLGGFQDDSVTVVEGAAANIGHGTGLSIYLLSFIDEYWEDGTPKDFQSNVGLYKDGAKVESGIIRVNHPMRYEGVRIHQGTFGPAVRLLISDEGGTLVLKDHVALTGVRVNDSLQRPEGMVNLPDSGYNIFILGSAVNGEDPFIGKGQIGLEFYDADMNFLGWLLLDEDAPQQLLGLRFSYDSLQYAGFLVSKNPGTPILQAAAFLFLLGLVMIFYFPRRRIWVRISPVSESAAMLSMKLDAKLEPGLEREAFRIRRALKHLEKPEGSQ
jgi:cytochrome c biogenesis protein